MKPGTVRRRTITLFVLGIVVPGSLLAYLAFRGIRNDQALLERERRDSLRQLLDDVLLAHDATLTLLGESLDAIVAMARGIAEDPSAIAGWVERTRLVDAVFRLSPEDRIDRLIAPHRLYGEEPGMGENGPSVASDPAFGRARRREFAAADLTGALRLYRDIVRTSSSREVRADALNAVARLEREFDNWPASLNAYARPGTEYGDVPTAGGIPFRLVARLESGLTKQQKGDAEAAARSLVALYAELMRAGASLSGSQHAFLAGRARDSAASAITGITVPVVRETLTDSLSRLTSPRLSRAGCCLA